MKIKKCMKKQYMMWSTVNLKIRYIDQKDFCDHHRIGYIKFKDSNKWGDNTSKAKRWEFKLIMDKKVMPEMLFKTQCKL